MNIINKPQQITMMILLVTSQKQIKKSLKPLNMAKDILDLVNVDSVKSIDVNHQSCVTN